MKIATWNVNSLRVRLPHLAGFLAANPLDAIALQETKLPDADFPVADVQALGWSSAFSGQRTYNGVAILSRTPATDIVAGIPGFEDEQRRVLAATIGGLRIIERLIVGDDKITYDEILDLGVKDFRKLSDLVGQANGGDDEDPN